MLREIKISNLAIVPESHVKFDQGLNILTGETGAGKSILLDAIGLLAGKRAQAQDVRDGAPQATVEGILAFPDVSAVWNLLDEYGIPKDGEEILLRRIITPDGRSRAFVNDTSTTVGVLGSLSTHWLDMTGQHTQQKLLDAASHTDILDEFLQLDGVRLGYAQTFSEVRNIDRKIRELKQQKEKALEEKEYYEFRLKELVEADLKIGEEADLLSIHQRISHQEKLLQSVSLVDDLLSQEQGTLVQVGKVQVELRAMGKYDESIAPYMDLANQAFAALSEVQLEISKYKEKLDVDPSEIESMNARLSLLQRIARKFGSVEKAMEERDKIKSLLSATEEGNFVEKELIQQKDALGTKLLAQAKTLSKERIKGAKQFSAEVTKELKGLGMPSAMMDVRLVAVGHSAETIEVGKDFLGATGLERVEFYFSPNPGEATKPLESIASGGELSRVLLALKGIALKHSKNSQLTYVFDEVDAGIGGETAERVGLRLKSLASGRQVLCVTHLAQVACYADTHLQVAKSQSKGRTVSSVFKLDEVSRKRELARMIGGIEITEKTQAHANELLGRAQNVQTSSLTPAG